MLFINASIGQAITPKTNAVARSLPVASVSTFDLPDLPGQTERETDQQAQPAPD